jgi:hypothetical protein
MFFLEFFQGIYTFTLNEPQVVIGRLLLVALGIFLIWMAYRKVLEPLIMLPLGIGMIAVNAGLMVLEAGNVGNLFINPLESSYFEEIMYFLQIDFLQPVYTFMFTNGLIACLVFLSSGPSRISISSSQNGNELLPRMFAELGTIVTHAIAIAMGSLRRGRGQPPHRRATAHGPYDSIAWSGPLRAHHIVAYLLGISLRRVPSSPKYPEEEACRGNELAGNPAGLGRQEISRSVSHLHTAGVPLPVARAVRLFVGPGHQGTGITRSSCSSQARCSTARTLFLGFTSAPSWRGFLSTPRSVCCSCSGLSPG